MRILAVTNMYPTHHAPASGTFVEQQIKSLRETGLKVEVAFFDRRQYGMRVYLGLKRKISSKLVQFRPDVVHVMYGGVMAEQLTRIIQDKPTVVTFHGSDLLGEHLSGFVRKLSAQFGVLSSHKAARRASGIVVVSKALQDTLPRNLNRPIKVIPCGVDVERFKPTDREVCRSQLGWDADRFHVLFPSNSGNLVKRPGLARAAVELVNRLGVEAEIHYLRGVPNSEVPIWINASDVVLLTSLHEGSPTVVKEALACDVPLVSVNVGDVAERILGIKGCYLARPEPSDLAEKLRLVFEGTRRVEGRVRVQELSLERIARRLVEFYYEVHANYKKKSVTT